jgi:16S rRNA (adenine1518-N6/adenine1519-N6)-dimethyltransferase
MMAVMDVRPKKSLGQHFLNSPAAIAKIVEAARIVPGETVLEIGPGTGVLTDALLKAGARVVAVEKDVRSFEFLKERFSKNIADGALALHQTDILKTDRTGLGLKDASYAVVANIPYYITGAILESFLEYEPRPDRMVLLVQKEVAERIVAKNKKEGVLSISVKAFGTPRIISKVQRGAFTPPPKVDSAILAIAGVSDQNFKQNGLEIRRFFEVIKAGFAHKRKLVRRNLEGTASTPKISRAWKKLSLDEKLRAEDMTLEDWLGIAKETQNPPWG